MRGPSFLLSKTGKTNKLPKNILFFGSTISQLTMPLIYCLSRHTSYHTKDGTKFFSNNTIPKTTFTKPTPGPTTHRFFATNVMPLNIINLHNGILQHIDTSDISALALIYGIIKQPDATPELIEKRIIAKKWPPVVQDVLYSMARRDLYSIADLAGLPGAEQIFMDLRACNATAARQKHKTDQETSGIEALRKKIIEQQLLLNIQLPMTGHLVLNNRLYTLSTDHVAENSEKSNESKPLSQIVAISFNNEAMYVHANFYEKKYSDKEYKVTTHTFKIDREHDIETIIDMLSGNITPKAAYDLVLGTAADFNKYFGAKELCKLDPGYHNAFGMAMAVIDSNLQSKLHKELLKIKTITDLDPDFLFPFEILRDLVNKKDIALSANGPLYTKLHTLLQNIILVLSDIQDLQQLPDKSDLNKTTTNNKISGQNVSHILYRLTRAKPASLLNQILDGLQRELSKDWIVHDKNIYVKKLPNEIIGLVYKSFADYIGVAIEVDYLGLVRFKSKGHFIRFQKSVIGENFDQPDIILRSSASKHHRYDFFDAIANGTAHIVFSYLEDGVDPMLGIKAAAIADDITIADILYEAGAKLYNPEAPETLLHIAASNNRLRFAEYLLAKENIGVNVLTNDDPHYRETALYRLCARYDNPDFIEFLIQSGANPNLGRFYQDQPEKTPLHAAMHNGYIKSACRLLDLGADPRIKDCFGNTIFDLAMAFNKPRTDEQINLKTELLQKLHAYAATHNLDKERHDLSKEILRLRKHEKPTTTPDFAAKIRSQLPKLSLTTQIQEGEIVEYSRSY